jgi:hypothetical protein
MFMVIALALSAQASFSNASLKGGYSFLTNRWTADVNRSQEGVVGVMTFDGAGNVTASYTSISGGVLQTGTASGTYIVNSNGTGAISFTTGSSPPQFAITLTSSAAGLAHGMQLLRTNDNRNLVESGTALLQSTTATTYTLASVKGNFGLQLNEWDANVNDSQEGIVGIASFDGAGKVKGSTTDVNGGVVSKGTFTGTYTVNADGSASMSLTAGTDHPQVAFVLNSVSAGQAKGAQLLRTNSTGNKVQSGIALKQ